MASVLGFPLRLAFWGLIRDECCVKAGAKYVVLSGDKIYEIKSQNFASLAANAGTNVQITGDVDKDGKTITVTKVSPAGR